MTGRSRYYKHTIMSNAGFGALKIIKEDATMIIPQTLITREGLVYQRIQQMIDKKDYTGLVANGVIIYS